MVKIKVSIVLMLGSVAGCKVGGTIGPCVHTYEDPVLHIQSVTNAQTGQSVQALQILQVLLEGQKQDSQILKAVSFNVTVMDSTLLCGLPCGFGTEAGIYTLTVAARGCRDTTISLPAKYAVLKGGCPSSSSGGTQHSFQMQSQ